MITSLGNELREAYREKESANKEYSNISKPVIRDHGKIEEYWDWFKKGEDKTGSPTANRVFVVMMVVLYNPSYLVEGRLRKSKLRNKLSEILGMYPSQMSLYIAESFFWYRTYRDFKRCVDRCMSDFHDKYLTNNHK